MNEEKIKKLQIKLKEINKFLKEIIKDWQISKEFID